MALFGSALSNHFGPQSDIDLLVEFDRRYIPTLFDVVDMEMELTDILGRKVDLRTSKDLSSYFRDEVIAQAKQIYVKS